MLPNFTTAVACVAILVVIATLVYLFLQKFSLHSKRIEACSESLKILRTMVLSQDEVVHLIETHRSSELHRPARTQQEQLRFANPQPIAKVVKLNPFVLPTAPPAAPSVAPPAAPSVAPPAAPPAAPPVAPPTAPPTAPLVETSDKEAGRPAGRTTGIFSGFPASMVEILQDESEEDSDPRTRAAFTTMFFPTIAPTHKKAQQPMVITDVND
jgi:hypothetical protein